MATFKRKVEAFSVFENPSEDIHNMSKFREVFTISLRLLNTEKKLTGYKTRLMSCGMLYCVAGEEIFDVR
jgi:hypothetical protein